MWEGLWRRTVTLTREYPSLWLPVIVGDLAGFVLTNGRKSVTPYLVDFLFRGRSALGFETVDHSAVRTALAYGLAGSLVQLVRFVSIAFYAAAFLFTARMVMERVGVQGGDRRNPTRSALLLGLRAYLIAIPLGLALFIPLYLSAVWPRWHATLTHWLIADLSGLLMMALLAYVMVPPALRALTSSSMPQPDHASIRLGRKCAVAAVIASTGLLILEHIIGKSIYASHSQVLVAQAIMSLVASLPYAPLYVALSLLAEKEQVQLPEERIALIPGEA